MSGLLRARVSVHGLYIQKWRWPQTMVDLSSGEPRHFPISPVCSVDASVRSDPGAFTPSSLLPTITYRFQWCVSCPGGTVLWYRKGWWGGFIRSRYMLCFYWNASGRHVSFRWGGDFTFSRMEKMQRAFLFQFSLSAAVGACKPLSPAPVSVGEELLSLSLFSLSIRSFPFIR